MNLAPFEFALRKNYYRHNGPFNWIATGFDMSTYWLLGPQEKKAALLSVYTGHFDTISNLCENTTAIEKVYKRPTNHNDFFQLILCTELIRLKKNGADLSAHSVGDYATPIENKELIQLIPTSRRT